MNPRVFSAVGVVLPPLASVGILPLSAGSASRRSGQGDPKKK